MVLFNEDRRGFTIVYTDGACSNNGRRNAKAGIGVWFGEDNPYNVSRRVYGRATNNTAEIEAVTEAAREALNAGIHRLMIFTDSNFVINCVTRWMSKWKRNGWRTCRGHVVINKEELIEMEDALEDLEDYKIKHVRSHDGDYGNEMADELARRGAADYEQHYNNYDNNYNYDNYYNDYDDNYDYDYHSYDYDSYDYDSYDYYYYNNYNPNYYFSDDSDSDY